MKYNMDRLKKEKKALSPVISTVLLIMIVVVLALIILMWAFGFVKEAYSKTIGGEEKPVDYYCSQLNLEGFVNLDGTFGFSNRGSVPIHSFTLRLTGNDGETNIENYESPKGSVNPGGVFTFKDKGNYDSYKDVRVISVLLAKKKSSTNPEPVPCASENALKI